MPLPEPYTTEQIRSLEEAFRAGELPSCPACSVVMDQRPMPPRSDVSYVRDRLLLLCSRCHRTHVLDVTEAR